ncbi:MAG: ABC transporter substrate-binding protein, partial [Oscillospiraceae bacterium]|nr:ABC transporter substrate-binding protein [Oscillospiraceae bacterium]
MKKIIALLLALCLVVCLFAGCKEQYDGADTLVYATASFGQKFSPFFYTTAYDGEVVDMIHAGLLGSDREGNMILDGMDGVTIPYNGTDYEYETLANCEVVQNADGSVDYNITMRDDIKFSDGEKADIDDVIFGIYVSADPTYDGSTTLYAVPIEGIQEYYSSMDTKMNLIVSATPDAVADGVTQEETDAFWTAFWAAGEKFAQEIVDYCVAMGYGADSADVATAAEAWGYALEEGATAADFFTAIVETCGYSLSDDGINYESAGTSITDFILAELGDSAATYQEAVQLADVPNIAGIKKTGDYTMTVHCTEYDATAIYNMSFTVAPLHYYGDESLYDYDNNSFGFPKGDLSIVREKT